MFDTTTRYDEIAEIEIRHLHDSMGSSQHVTERLPHWIAKISEGGIPHSNAIITKIMNLWLKG